MNIRQIARTSGAAVAVLLATASSAMAAVPLEVTTAITDAQTDSVTVAVGFTVAALLVKGIHMLRRG